MYFVEILCDRPTRCKINLKNMFQNLYCVHSAPISLKPLNKIQCNQLLSEVRQVRDGAVEKIKSTSQALNHSNSTKLTCQVRNVIREVDKRCVVTLEELHRFIAQVAESVDWTTIK
ncbi:hypothetical protein ILYODFUR_010105 [Ilyodon furcidens]|uniref:Uncharacterized protein n=1 Tax=Ilyodon furcidens TaxID=33524 RepID=A0ABV0T6R4_9TELE